MLAVVEVLGAQRRFAYGGNLNLADKDEALLCVAGSSTSGHTSVHKILSEQWHILR